jgi:hypothetical protein
MNAAVSSMVYAADSPQEMSKDPTFFSTFLASLQQAAACQLYITSLNH